MSEAANATLAVPVNERDHVMGPPNAPVIVVNYGDYQCPGCQKRHRSTEKMARELMDRVRLVHRHFPLLKTHPRALRAAEAAEAAAAQSKFWEMHRLLYLRPDKLGDRDLHSDGKGHRGREKSCRTVDLANEGVSYRSVNTIRVPNCRRKGRALICMQPGLIYLRRNEFSSLNYATPASPRPLICNCIANTRTGM